MKPINFDMNTARQYGLEKSFDQIIATMKAAQSFNEAMNAIEKLDNEALGSLLIHIEVILNNRQKKSA